MPKLINHRTMAGIRSPLTSIARSVIGQGKRTGFSAPVRDYFARLGALRVREYDAANARLIDRLVANGGNFWPASGAFCAMAGYLYPGNGEDLIPLHPNHDAGTLNAFVSGDWNAVTGLKGDGSTKYVDSNRLASANAQNNFAMGALVTTAHTSGTAGVYLGSGTVNGAVNLGRSGSILTELFARSQSTDFDVTTGGRGDATGLVSWSRSAGANFTLRAEGAEQTITQASQSPEVRDILIYALNKGPIFYSDARLPFYHIGPNLNGAGELVELDAALTEWKNALANA